MPRPRRDESAEPLEYLSIRVPKTIYDTLMQIAAEEDRSMAYIVRRILTDAVGEHAAKKGKK